jgi:hypothetical protein
MLRPQYARQLEIAAGAHEMADDKDNPASATAMPRVRRRAPTIDLKATEVAVEPPPSPAGDPAMAQSETPVPPDYPTEPPAYETSATAEPSASSDEPSKPSNELPRRHAAASFSTGPVMAASLAGGAVALIVFAALWLAGVFADAQSPSDQRLAAIEAQLREIAGRAVPRTPDNRPIEELNARLTRLESAAPRTGETSAPPSSELQTAVAGLTRRADDNATAIREARGQADAALVAADAARLAVERNNAEALGNRVAALERATKTLSEDVAKSLTAAGGDRPLRAAVAAQALRVAVERGDAYATELTAAKALFSNAAAFAPLEAFAANGLPSSAALARELAELAPSMQKAPPPTGGFLDRLQANAEKLVRIRPIDEMPGADPNAVISRAQAKATRSDLAGAATELNTLPADMRAPADAWIKKVEARTAAVNASRRLVADALAALGKAAP